MQVLVVERLLYQEIGERLRPQRRQTVTELAPRRRGRRLSEIGSLREPGESDRDTVLAEQPVPADRTRAGTREAAAGQLEPHAIALRPLHARPDRRLVPVQRPDRTRRQVLLAALERARSRQTPKRLARHQLRQARIHNNGIYADDATERQSLSKDGERCTGS